MSIIRDLANRFLFESKKKNIRVGKANYINRDTFFEGGNRVGSNNAIKGSIGFGTYIGSGCRLDAKIGRFCSISNDVIVLSTNHPTSFVSTSPTFYSTKRQNGISYVNQNAYIEETTVDNVNSVIIGNDVLISYGVYILGGVKIGDGVIIGANSVVTHDVEPYSIIAGNPAKLIRKRFSDEEIEKLINLKWWDWPEKKLREKADLFSDINALLDSEGIEK